VSRHYIVITLPDRTPKSQTKAGVNHWSAGAEGIDGTHRCSSNHLDETKTR
jgi:hypothetical protein